MVQRWQIGMSDCVEYVRQKMSQADSSLDYSHQLKYIPSVFGSRHQKYNLKSERLLNDNCLITFKTRLILIDSCADQSEGSTRPRSLRTINCVVTCKLRIKTVGKLFLIIWVFYFTCTNAWRIFTSNESLKLP